MRGSSAQTSEDSGVIEHRIAAFSSVDTNLGDSVLSAWVSGSLGSSVVQGKHDHDLGGCGTVVRDRGRIFVIVSRRWEGCSDLVSSDDLLGFSEVGSDGLWILEPLGLY